MPIPQLDADGRLPEGVHEASLAEVRARFGRFQRTDRRVRLQAALEAFVGEARASGLVHSIVVDGSFTSAAADPGDVDVIVVLRAGAESRADLRPDQYNVVSARRLRSRYPLDASVVSTDSADLEQRVDFFAQVRGSPGVRKGMVRVKV